MKLNVAADCLPMEYEFGWKHGYPVAGHMPESERPRGVFIVVVRDLNDWLHSTFNRPYHMAKRSTFAEFVDGKIAPREEREDHPVVADKRETGVTPLELFASKYAAWKQFAKEHRCVVVNLKHIQERGEEFLGELCEKYGLRKKEKTFFTALVEHTKTKRTFEKEQEQDKGGKEVPDALKNEEKGEGGGGGGEFVALEQEIRELTVQWFGVD